MTTELKKGINKKLDPITLKTEQMEKLLEMQDQFILPEPQSPTNIFKQAAFKRYAALFSITLLVSAILLANLQIKNHEDSISQLITNEVTYNHFKLKPLETNTNSIEEIRGYFSKLDFLPITPKLLDDPQLELLGGRYCSLQGNIAAHLRVKNQTTGEIHTLYQAAYNQDKFHELPKLENNTQPIIHYSKGMGVKIWVEKDVLHAFTLQNSD